MRIDYGRDSSGLYRLYRGKTFDTGIVGHSAVVTRPYDACTLDAAGHLHVQEGFLWDLASGAIDTPDMVIASLAHDALCRITNDRLVPWSVRSKADTYFRKLLKELGCSFVRRWYSFLFVRAYSLTLAKHRDRK